ncbi:hypothetical protein CNECB9_3980006 [Cupriavidus necator]|uniref:Uncharacterized protein n=1 Tax=Cupriavidus necator TaxID=106590 RepID=A0A1K0IK03_CUPNE|nr:hypothetical protein CNECB9_3980006 [Cupriavidus necator]
MLRAGIFVINGYRFLHCAGTGAR